MDVPDGHYDRYLQSDDEDMGTGQIKKKIKRTDLRKQQNQQNEPQETLID